MTIEQIAKAFSNGEFELIYESIAENAVWIVIEENQFNGKKAIIENCEQVGRYFKSVSTDFKTFNVISSQNKVVVNGTAEFLKNNTRVSFVSACDIYEFDINNQIQKITSYCIQSKQ
jgi:ketosteroid isomerase-like protein